MLCRAGSRFIFNSTLMPWAIKIRLTDAGNYRHDVCIIDFPGLIADQKLPVTFPAIHLEVTALAGITHATAGDLTTFINDPAVICLY